MKKNDVILIVCGLLLAGAAYLMFNLYSSNEDAKIHIYVDNELYQVRDLDEDGSVWINDTNYIEINNQIVDMIEANCPDKLCVHQKAISKDNESIICLPNKVVVEIDSSRESEFDSVVN